MKRLPFIHDDVGYATAVIISREEMILEPVRIWNGAWHVRRDGRLTPLKPGDADALVTDRGEVTDGYHTWKRLTHFLRDRGVRVPGDFDAADVAIKAAHWRAYRCAVESPGGRRGDAAVAATVARGATRQAA